MGQKCEITAGGGENPSLSDGASLTYRKVIVAGSRPSARPRRHRTQSLLAFDARQLLVSAPRSASSVGAVSVNMFEATRSR